MPVEQVQKNDELVRTYFNYIKDLRSGKEGSVEKLVSLWDDDGTFEFAGSPPVTGTFQGRNAIHTLYKNRFHASGMKMTLEASDTSKGDREAALGVVDTEVHRTKVMDGKIIAGWTTVIGTQDGRGFQVSGSHTFQFKDGKLSHVKVVVSPRPDTAKNLRMEGLSVDDIGRLALAAWPVV